MNIDEIKNGDIIRFASDNSRDWVVIHRSVCHKEVLQQFSTTNDCTPYYLFGGLWYEGNALTSQPYGKCIGPLKKGMSPYIAVVGHILKKEDYERYKKFERM